MVEQSGERHSSKSGPAPLAHERNGLACEPFQHDWREVYGGFKCCKCGHFEPFR